MSSVNALFAQSILAALPWQSSYPRTYICIYSHTKPLAASQSTNQFHPPTNVYRLEPYRGIDLLAANMSSSFYRSTHQRKRKISRRLTLFNLSPIKSHSRIYIYDSLFLAKLYSQKNLSFSIKFQ